jgi:hypothetical protein
MIMTHKSVSIDEHVAISFRSFIVVIVVIGFCRLFRGIGTGRLLSTTNGTIRCC